MDVEKKRLVLLYPFLSKEQIRSKAQDNINSRKRDVCELNAVSEGETHKKDSSVRNKAKAFGARYKPLSGVSTKVKTAEKVIEVIDLSSDDEAQKPASVKNEEDFDWKSMKIKTEPVFDVKGVKKSEPKFREDTKKTRGYGRIKAESIFDKLLLSDTKNVPNSELKIGEDCNDKEGWRPFMNKTRSYVRTEINDYKSTKIPGSSGVEKELSSVESRSKCVSSNIRLSGVRHDRNAELKASEKDAWRPLMSGRRSHVRTEINDYKSEKLPGSSGVEKVVEELGSVKSRPKCVSSNIRLSGTRYDRNAELKSSEKDAWRPFMSGRSHVRTEINNNEILQPSSVNKKDNAKLSLVKRKLKFGSDDIQETRIAFMDKSKVLQPGVDHNSWEITESMNCEKLKIKTIFSESSDNDSVPEVKNNFRKKSNAHKFLKLDPGNIQIKNVGGNEKSKVNKYLNWHFYSKDLNTFNKILQESDDERRTMDQNTLSKSRLRAK